MTRQFSKTQKQAVELVSGRSGDGDHIQPFSEGGPTQVENCQLLNQKTNQKKGAFKFEPRLWQRELLKAWHERQEGSPFLLIAIPGGGKTFAALEAARLWTAAGADRRLVVVVPSTNLQEQWKGEAINFGIELQTNEFGTKFKDDFQGGAVTYHLVASQPLLFRKLCSVSPTMVVFDEVHHCGDEAHFGKGIIEAFGLAKEKLLMSGTPWKSDGNSIPFVKYDGNGYAVGDFVYDYPRALTEDVVRYLVFEHSKGSIRNDCTNKVEALSQETSDEDASRRLRKLLGPSGEYAREQVGAAHRKLMECRRTVPDAAAMAVCIDQQHAAEIAKVIQDETGCTPSLIVSDSALENDTVKEFKKSGNKKEWLVSVRKVSEGTDIKRLQVLCYLTNTTTELFFRQVIGRVSRVRGKDDFEGYVYLPADPRLIRCSQNITNAQVQALREKVERESRELDRDDDGYEPESYSTIYDGTEVVMIGNERVPLADAKRIELMAEAFGVSMQKVMGIIEMNAGQEVVSEPQQTTHEPMEDRLKTLRKKCSSFAFHLSKVLDIKVQDVHRKFKKQADMTEQELKQKLESLLAEIKRQQR